MNSVLGLNPYARQANNHTKIKNIRHPIIE